jgi:hypothetical protein
MHRMTTTSPRGRAISLAALIVLFGAAASLPAQGTAAREWNELLLESIRRDFPRPTVHARNLFHISTAMWDAWATYDQTAKCLIFDESHPTTSPTIDAMRSETLSYASYRILRARFGTSPGAATVLPLYDALMVSLGYNPADTSTVGNTPAAIGNRLALKVRAFGAADQSNEVNGFVNQHYQPINAPLLPDFPGNPNLLDPNRWQPLSLQFFIGQNGIPVPTGYPQFLSPEWGQVTPFALSQRDLTVNHRGGFDYWVYHDPGSPPLLGSLETSHYKNGFEMVVAWSSHLDPADGVMIDISPGSIGNSSLPTGLSQYGQFYDFVNGGDWGTGHALNPVTGQPYAPQIVPRGDYTRVLAEFWADGPHSETPPGHWFTIFNYVADHPLTVKRIGGTGPVVNDLEWDVKGYLALGGAMHDCAISAWGIKGWYDYLRPISAIRYMADRHAGNANDPTAITLHPGLIEVVTAATAAPGQRHAHLAGSVGKVAVRAWRGPDYIQNPAIQTAGVGWILAEDWWPYQRPTFVTPPFAGYVSGHSTYSRAAAVVMDRFTGSPWFPGGLGQFVCPQNTYLVFEDGPSVTITLQWASYYDASDQCSLSRIWGGIHPPADDIPGRHIGQAVGNDAFDLAQQLWAGTAPARASYATSGLGCVGSNGLRITLSGVPSAQAVIGSTLRVEIDNLTVPANAVLMMAGTVPIAPGLDLGVIGAPGCTLDQQILVFDLLAASGGQATWTLPIPNSPVWLGQSILHQVASNDPMANAFGVTTSNAGAALVGF